MIFKVIGLILALTAANFLYQMGTKQDWKVAVERSFFQAIAVGITLMTFAREIK